MEEPTRELTVGFQPTDQNIELLKTTLTSAGTALTDNELRLFLYQAKQTGLDPLAKQIYVMKSGGKLTFMTSIDGQRLVAQRTGQYQGQVGPQWCGKDGVWTDVWLKEEPPAAARVGVYRTGFKEPVYGVATWKSYAKPASQTWRQLGDVMLAKCAESLAIRKAFPQELSGVYTAEEMDQHQPEPRLKRMPASEDEPMPYVDELPTDEQVEQVDMDAVFTPNPMTPKQRGMLFAVLTEKGVKAADAKYTLYAVASSRLGKVVEKTDDISKEDASTLIDHIKGLDSEALSLFFGGEA